MTITEEQREEMLDAAPGAPQAHARGLSLAQFDGSAGCASQTQPPLSQAPQVAFPTPTASLRMRAKRSSSVIARASAEHRPAGDARSSPRRSGL